MYEDINQFAQRLGVDTTNALAYFPVIPTETSAVEHGEGIVVVHRDRVTVHTLQAIELAQLDVASLVSQQTVHEMRLQAVSASLAVVLAAGDAEAMYRAVELAWGTLGASGSGPGLTST